MKKIFVILGILIIVFSIFSITSPNILAQGWTQGQEAVSSGNTGLPETSVKDVVLNILKWLLALVFLLTVLAFVGSGVMFIMSFSNSGIIDMAKSWLTYAIIGLVVSVLGFVVVLAISNMLRGDLYSVQGRGSAGGGNHWFNIFGQDNNGNDVNISTDGNTADVNGNLGGFDFDFGGIQLPTSPGGNNTGNSTDGGTWTNPDTGQPYDYNQGR